MSATRAITLLRNKICQSLSFVVELAGLLEDVEEVGLARVAVVYVLNVEHNILSRFLRSRGSWLLHPLSRARSEEAVGEHGLLGLSLLRGCGVFVLVEPLEFVAVFDAGQLVHEVVDELAEVLVPAFEPVLTQRSLPKVGQR